MDPAEKLSPAPAENTVPLSRSYRTILIVGGQKLEIGKALSPHRVLTARGLETSFEQVRDERPDLIVYFDHGRDDRLEEHVMTWLIEGFRGKVLVLDPDNRLKDAETLLEGQVIDDHLSGPVSPHRFVSIIKSHLGGGAHSGSPRTLTTFDLFRNLYERGINAIFFLSEDFERCLAANLAAEQITGRSLYELRHLGLKEICDPSRYDETIGVIRRAARRYYDMRGQTSLRGREGRKIDSAFSCSWMNFGRRRFLKLEVQVPFFRRKEDIRAIDQTAILGAVDESLKESVRAHADLSLITFEGVPHDAHSSETDDDEFMNLLETALASGIRNYDRLVRVGHLKFGILLPKTDEAKAQKVLERLKKKVGLLQPVKDEAYAVRSGYTSCRPETFPFLGLLSSHTA